MTSSRLFRRNDLNEGINGSELVTFEHASHMQFVEEPERYRELVAGFLDRVEQG